MQGSQSGCESHVIRVAQLANNTHKIYVYDMRELGPHQYLLHLYIIDQIFNAVVFSCFE